MSDTFASFADQLPATLPQPVLVPLFDRQQRESAYHQGVALRAHDGSVGPPIAVVGSRFTPPDLRALGDSLDHATADLGGIARLGPARARISDRGALSLVIGREHGHPDALLAPRLTSDPSDRSIFLRMRSALDGTEAEILDLMMVRILCKNGLVGFGSVGGFTRRHTGGLDADRALWAASARQAIPAEMDRQARVLRFLREYAIPRTETAEVFARFVSGDVVSEVGPDADSLGSYRQAQVATLIDYVASADGTYVPAPIHGPGYVDGLQLLEAATAYDRHHARGSVDKRRERVMAGRGIGATALAWGVRLAGNAGVL